MLLPLTAAAQDEQVLGEVVVEAARVVHHADGSTHFPTSWQKEHSTQAYSLLAKLSLPGIRVDETQRTIETVANQGSVQVRINDLPATRDDLLTLDPQSVSSIIYIDSPGLRYGEDVAYVIDIRTRRAVSGYTLGADLLAAVSTVATDNELSAKWNHGSSEWAVTYHASHQHTRHCNYDETTRYLLPDGNYENVSRQSTDGRRTTQGHDLSLTWSMADSATYVVQARLSANLYRMPLSQRQLLFTTPDAQTRANDEQTQRTLTPVADLYIYHRLSSHQSLTANIVGTLIRSRQWNRSDEGTPYEYRVRGCSRSLTSEAIYENQLRPFHLSAGVQWQQRYTDNTYSGSADSRNAIHTSTLYVFSQLKGHVGPLGYVGGLGVSTVYFREGSTSYRFYLWRPRLSLSLPLLKGLHAKYDFEIAQHVSQIANISDVTIRQNSREWQTGNPDLRPNRVTHHTLTLNYERPRLSLMLMAHYRRNHQCNMSYTEPFTAADGTTGYLHGQRNQPSCNLFFSQLYGRWDIIPERLTASLGYSIGRYFNIGSQYRHFYTSCNLSGSLQAYLGRWTMTAYADNGYRWMEGETRGHQAPSSTLAVRRQWGNWSLGLYWQHALSPHPAVIDSELQNHYVHRHTTISYPSYGNMLSLNLTWTLSHGRQYRPINRTLHLEDRETGIM